MADLSTTAANLAGTAITNTAAFLSLHIADPGTTGANEVTGGSYARQSVTWNAWASGATTSSNGQTFSGMPSEAGNLWVGTYTLVTGGSFVWGGASAAVTGPIAPGATVTFLSGAVSGAVS